MRNSERDRLWGLEALRGICALMVAVYRCAMWAGVAHLDSWGMYGVYVFFVISGAVLYYNYSDVLVLSSPGPRQLSVGSFLMKRFARLAPLYAASAASLP